MSTRFLRNKDLIDQSLLDEIAVIGLGGIGSALIHQLAIMGWRHIIGFDADRLEEHNLSTTMYPLSAVGMTKAESAANVASSYVPEGSCTVDMRAKLFTADSRPSKIMIACTDSMSSRLNAYRQWVKQEDRIAFIDIRMGALSINIVTTTKDRDNYVTHWKPDDEIDDEACTMKHTIFTASIAAGLGVNQLFSAISNKLYREYVWIGLQPLQCELGALVIPQME